MSLVVKASSYYHWKIKNHIVNISFNWQFVNSLQRHSRDAYFLPIKKNGDCCGVVGNGCNQYGLYTSISG